MKRFILLLVAAMTMVCGFAQSDEPEKSSPSRDTEIARRCLFMDIEGKYYRNCVVTLKSTSPDYFITDKYKVKVLVEDENGKKPAEEFIDSLDVKMRAKVFGRLELLEKHGSELGMPFSRHLDDGVFELRTVVGNNITRILYFFVVGRRVILTHGFVKKTRKTPAREIDRAKKIREDWRRRNE